MAFREKNPNVLAGNLTANKKSRTDNSAQKPRGYVLTPSLDSASNKENEQPWQSGILAKHGRDKENHQGSIKKTQVASSAKIDSLGTIWTAQNAKKTPSSEKENAQPLHSGILANHDREKKKNQDAIQKIQETSTTKMSSLGTAQNVKKAPPPPTLPMDFAGAVRSTLGNSPSSAFTTNNRVSLSFSPSSTLGEYTRVLVGLSKSKDPNAGEHAQEVLQRMLDQFHTGQSLIRPDACCYNMVIVAYKDKADRAEQVLQLMWDDYMKGGNTLAEPNLHVYTSILNAWGHSKESYTAERCEIILQQMHDMHNSGLLRDCKPDLHAYTAVFHSWGSSQSKSSGRRAEMLFRRMVTRFRDGDESLRPDAAAYANVLQAYIGGPNAPRAEDILWEMVSDYQNGNNSAKPISLRVFNNVVAVWSKTESPHAPERAESIIHRIHELYNAGALAFKPNSYTYSLMLKSWAVSGRNDSAERAHAVLSWMKDRFNAGDSNAQLTAIHYTTCIGIWVSANDMHQAEALWIEMYKDYINGNHFAEPDVVVCNRILTGWARSNDNAAVDRAEIMLQHMWKLHDAGLPDIRPTVGSYNSIIFCWKHSRRPYAPTRVDSLLHEMGRFFNIGRTEKPPSHVSFREAIKTWKQSAYSTNKTKRISMLERELYKRFGIVDDGSKGVPRGGRSGNYTERAGMFWW